MLRKKYTVQKSIRIDAQLSEDLERLAKILDRPQSELINMAIESLILDNRVWFAQFIYVDAMSGIFDRDEGYAEYQITYGDITAKVSVDASSGDGFLLTWSMEDGSGIIDSLEKAYANDEVDALTDKLIELTVYIDKQDKSVQDYLSIRLDYK